MDTEKVRSYVKDAMPELLENLGKLVSIPSIAFPGFPPEPMEEIGDKIIEMAKVAGVDDARRLDLGAGYPAIVGELAGPREAPTVTLYAHYDVQPAPESQGWTVDPWTMSKGQDGRLYGRGVADDKAGLCTFFTTLAAFKGKPPVTVRLLLEGEEETKSHIEGYIDEHPEEFQSDAFVVADTGPVSVGSPTLTKGLRGDISLTVTVKTFERALHSGVFGGVAPDPLVALIQLLASIYDESGSVVVEGLDGYEWEGPDAYSEEHFRAAAAVYQGVPLQGTGKLASRVWSKPSATVIGIDVPPVAGAANAIQPQAKARISFRTAPGSDGATQLAAIKKHLLDHAPRGVKVEFSDYKLNEAWLAKNGPIQDVAAEAMAEAYGVEHCSGNGIGGSIPIVRSFLNAAPHAEALLWGVEDEEKSRIHGPDESVDPAEIERLTVAQILFLKKLGENLS